MQVFFAWVDPGTPWDESLAVEDEAVFSVLLDHKEGGFATLALEIQNPRQGLLADGRKVWAWLAWSEDGEEPVPLFYGRLEAVPSGVDDDVVRLDFIARPLDWDEQRAALAETLRVAPYWDPVWLQADRRGDPDAVLEARPALWHIDRVSHVVSISDVTAGEDGLVDIAGGFFEDSLDIEPLQPPVRRVRVEAQVDWTQRAAGEVDLHDHIAAAAIAEGTAVPNAITTLTGDGLMDDWPRKGDRIGGGWEVGTSAVRRGDGVVVPENNVQQVYAVQNRALAVPVWTLYFEFAAAYDVARRYTETLAFTLEADCQALVTEPGDEEALTISVAADEVDSPIDPGDEEHPDGLPPIGDLRRRSYLQTDRGHRSVEYLIALARTQLLFRARAVEVTAEIPFADGVGLSCRKNLRLADARIPGGQATGKVIAYSLRIDGDSGEAVCSVRIGCMVGQGNTVTAEGGEPDYVEDGYVEPGYQTRTGQLVMPIAGAVTYAEYAGTPINDDAVNFFDLRAADIVDTVQVINGIANQTALLATYHDSYQAALTGLAALYTEVFVSLEPLGSGPFTTHYDLVVSDLMVPKTIDLEAAP